LPDVYAGIGLDSRPYDAIFDVFPVLQPVPAELHALRLLLACSGRLSRATLSALDNFAASAGIDMAMPLTSTVAIMPAIKAVAQRYMIRSFELIRSLESLVHY
jgi:hypothetical protein